MLGGAWTWARRSSREEKTQAAKKQAPNAGGSWWTSEGPRRSSGPKEGEKTEQVKVKSELAADSRVKSREARALPLKIPSLESKSENWWYYDAFQIKSHPRLIRSTTELPRQGSEPHAPAPSEGTAVRTPPH